MARCRASSLAACQGASKGSPSHTVSSSASICPSVLSGSDTSAWISGPERRPDVTAVAAAVAFEQPPQRAVGQRLHRRRREGDDVVIARPQRVLGRRRGGAVPLRGRGAGHARGGQPGQLCCCAGPRVVVDGAVGRAHHRAQPADHRRRGQHPRRADGLVGVPRPLGRQREQLGAERRRHQRVVALGAVDGGHQDSVPRPAERSDQQPALLGQQRRPGRACPRRCRRGRRRAAAWRAPHRGERCWATTPPAARRARRRPTPCRARHARTAAPRPRPARVSRRPRAATMALTWSTKPLSDAPVVWATYCSATSNSAVTASRSRPAWAPTAPGRVRRRSASAAATHSGATPATA